MRKLIGLAATAAIALTTAGSALAGQGATNPNGEFIDLSVAVSPPIASTARVPRGVAVSFDSFTGNRINGNTPSDTTSITVRFNRGFKFNGARFPSCQINLTALTTCPASTRIGTGTAEAEIPGANGAPPTFVPANLVAYNGKPLSGSTRTVIFIAVLNGTPAAELDFTVRQQPSGPYGLAFTQIPPPPNTPPPSFGITKFSVNVPDRSVTRRVRGKRTRVHLVEAPRTCRGSWRFAQTNTFSNAPALTATDSQPCVRR